MEFGIAGSSSYSPILSRRVRNLPSFSHSLYWKQYNKRWHHGVFVLFFLFLSLLTLHYSTHRPFFFGACQNKICKLSIASTKWSTNTYYYRGGSSFCQLFKKGKLWIFWSFNKVRIIPRTRERKKKNSHSHSHSHPKIPKLKIFKL